MMHELFKDKMDKLNRQVIHMDQGVAYCPEFRVTRDMSDYPSRKMEVVRSIALGYAPASDRANEIVRNHILSRLGERWQNFREDPDEYTELMLTSRQMLLEMGFGRSLDDQIANQLSSSRAANSETSRLWNNTLPLGKNTEDWVFLNDSTWNALSDKAMALGSILRSQGIVVQEHEEADNTGWIYFAHGLIEKGDAHLRNLVSSMESRGVKRIITTCGQSTWIWTELMKSRGIHHDFEIVDMLELLDRGARRSIGPVYLYAGSFYTRYLNYSGLVNRLFSMEKRTKLAAGEELNPRFETHDGSVNEVNIWQKPFCPEYETFDTVSTEVLDGIYSDARRDYDWAPKSTLVVFEPHAWARLGATRANKVYFWELFVSA